MRSFVYSIAAVAAATAVYGQDRTTEQGEAAIKDPAVECSAYNYPTVTNALPKFPTPWTTADIVSGDTAAQNAFNAINATVPTNIKVKGLPNGDFSGFTPSYPATDPDCWWTYHQCTTPKLSNLSNDVIDLPEPMSFGIGFDDGPNCSHNAFYDYLESQNQKATMFYIGSNVMYHPLEAQRAVADGHEVCVHTWSHQYMTAFTNEQAFAELYYTRQAIKLVTGVTPTCWRPPYGDVDDRIRTIAAGLGLRNIVWTYDSDDWKSGTTDPVTHQIITPQTVDSNYDALLTAAKNGTFATKGTIMLTHELNNFTMSEMIKYYPQLKAAFKSIVPVGVGYNITQPYLETNYSLPTFKQYTSGTTVTTGPAPGAQGNSTAGKSAGSDGTLSGSSSNNGNGGSNPSSGNGNGNSGASNGKSGAMSLNASVASMGVALVAAFVGSMFA